MAISWYGGEWYSSEWYDGAQPIVVIDTHDGVRKRRRWEEQRQARERLREQIRLAIDGPDAEILVPALERVAKPGPEPLAARVQIGDLIAQIELYRAVQRATYAAHEARERSIDDDDDEILMML